MYNISSNADRAKIKKLAGNDGWKALSSIMDSEITKLKSKLSTKSFKDLREVDSLQSQIETLKRVKETVEKPNNRR